MRSDLAGVRRRPQVFAFLSAPIDTPPSHGSLARNQLCGLDRYGCGNYTAEGITKLCEALKGSAVTALKCAAAQECSLPCQRPLTLLHSRAGSLAKNQLCGVYQEFGDMEGTYSIEGIAVLCEGLKGSSVTSLECAAAPSVRFYVNAH